MIPGEEAKIRKLTEFPTSPAEENASILKIIEFYNLLEARQRLDLFSVSFYNECMTKLSPFNSKYYSKYSKKHIKKMSKFIKHLEQILEENGKSLGAKGLPRFKTETMSPPSTDSEFTAYDDLNLDTENQTKILKTGTVEEPKESEKKRYCNFCNGEHLTYSCPTLLNLDTDECINLLVSKQICPRCLGKAREDCEKQECNSIRSDQHVYKC